MQRWVALLIVMIATVACEDYSHDENLAAKHALEFAEVTFVQQNFDKGYLLMGDRARAYVPMDKFKETVLSLHRNGYPTKIEVVGAYPIKGEKVVKVELKGIGNADAGFNYSLTMNGTAQAGYRVATF